MVEDEYQFTRTTWNKSNRKQKEDLLEAHGYSKTFAEAEDTDELARRGGGMFLRDLHRTTKEWRKRNPDTEVKW